MSELDIVSTNQRTIIDLRQLGFKSFLVLGRYNYCETQPKLVTHTHEGMIEICYLASGYQTYSIGDKIFNLKGGDVIINGPGIPHGSSGYPEDRGCLYWVIIKSSDPHGKILNLCKKDSQLVFEKLLKISNFKFSGNLKMKKDLDRVFQKAKQKPDPFSRIEISHYLMRFLLKVFDASEKHKNRQLHPRTIKIIEYVRNNPCEDISLEFLANMCNWSLSHFKQKFKADTGIPPWDFIQREKIKKAITLLETTGQSISSIAWQLGFTSPGYFSTVFRKHTGQNPKDMRIT